MTLKYGFRDYIHAVARITKVSTRVGADQRRDTRLEAAEILIRP